MSASDLVAQLAAAGTPPELLAAVAKELFTAEAERAILAERRQNERARKAKSREDTGSHVTERDSAGQTVTPPTPNKSPPDPQKLTPTPCVRGNRARARFAAPEGVSDDQWGGFLSLRAAKRQPMTDRGYSLLCGKLATLAEHGFPPGEMIDLAIERGWTTVHEPKDQPNAQRSHNHRPSGWEQAYHANMGAVGPQ